jgi:hypothetical protein
MRTNSLQRRPILKVYHDADAVAIPYCDYQRCTREPNSQTYENWDKIRTEWAPVVGPLPEKIEDVLELDTAGASARGKGYTFCPDADWTLMRAFLCVAVDTNSGADGQYFDNQYYAPKGCYCKTTTAAFQKWLQEQFKPDQLKGIFGTDDVAQLTPAKAAEGGGVSPLRVAWMRYRCWKEGWLREQIMAFGRSLNPNFVMMSTYWTHAGSPFSVIVASATNIEDMTKDGNRDTMLFWEPETAGPHRGDTEADAKAAAEKDAKTEYRFGRRSFSCSLKQMAGASYVPVVSKQKPPGANAPMDALTELCMAESYANLVTPRTGLSNPYSPAAIERMHAFQVAHPDLFVGAKLYPRVALLCSPQQGFALRQDADAVPFSRRLMDIGLEHQVISDRHVTLEGLANFDLLFIYNAALLTDPQLRALEEFKERGTLVIIGSCGTHDEWNRPRPAQASGMERLVGDLARSATEAAPAVSPDKHVVYMPLGAITKWHGDFWYRHNDDGDMTGLVKAIERSCGKAWPYLANRPERVEIHLMEIPKSGRLLAQIVNYDVSGDDKVTPAPAFALAVKLEGNKTPTKAFLAAPEMGKETKPLELRLETREGARYAVVQLPSIHIYGIVAID